jgi:hypothetical protein
MKQNNIKKEYEKFTEKYKYLFRNYIDIWEDALIKCEEYINKNEKLPSSKDKNKDIKYLGSWISDQKKNYKNNKRAMKNQHIKTTWNIFTEKYKYLFRSNEEIWLDTLIKISDYIKENKQLPSSKNKNKNIKYLGSWILKQKNKYNNNLIKEFNLKKEWENFTEKYKEYFK